MILVLSLAMFASGLSALVFETLWFRQTGLVLGNSLWASSLTLAAFMAGLAVGNVLIARRGDRFSHPIRVYAILEVTIGVAGTALVWILPSLAGALAPVWRPLIDQPVILNGLRLLTGFILLMVPAIAMGATLPLLAKALLSRDPNFGSVLGRLYGWNTLGAVLGAVAGELFLLGWLGVLKTALAAAGANLLAAVAALSVLRGVSVMPDVTGETNADAASVDRSSTNWRLLGAVFVSGFILLALEVVWFRFLELFVWNSSSSFALMLAVVLAGVAVGGRTAGHVMRMKPDADRHAGPIAFLAGATVVLGYGSFSSAYARLVGVDSSELVLDDGTIILLAMVLTFLTSLLSGALFTLVGALLQRVVPSGVAAAGYLTLSNTLGGAVGAFASGFVIVPLLGMERALFALAALYGLVGLLLVGRIRAGRIGSGRLRALWGLPLAFALVCFPFGAMRSEHLKRVGEAFGLGDPASVAVVRETRTETLMLLRRRFFGKTLNYLLVTGGFGMASTDEWSRRYMKQFVFLPLNLHPAARHALLISFGTGSTAKALSDVADLEQIDIVDISEDILSLSDIVYPDPSENPLKDDRVRIHVDDGRFFLLTTDQSFDLITSEPPPPKQAGVVNLYTREFFELVRSRLNEGGMNTHWLPAHALSYDDTRAIVRAYCEVFPDCTLWKGINLNWMLMGSREAKWTPSEAGFLERWKRLEASREGHRLGVELPEQLGAMFLGDARSLEEWTSDVEPLQDGYPKRVVDDPPTPSDYDALRAWTRPEEASRRFRESRFIARTWPRELRDRSAAFFRFDGVVNAVFLQEFGSPPTLEKTLSTLDAVLAVPGMEMLAAWLLGAHGDYLAVIDRNPELRETPVALQMRARRAFARRRFEDASRLFRRLPSRNAESIFLDAYATAMSGNLAEAEEIVVDAQSRVPAMPWAWLRRRFGIERDEGGGP